MKPMYFTGHTLLNLHYPAAVDVERCGNQGDEKRLEREGEKRRARSSERGSETREYLVDLQLLATNSQHPTKRDDQSKGYTDRIVVIYVWSM